jgi:hypothetical protein
MALYSAVLSGRMGNASFCEREHRACLDFSTRILVSLFGMRKIIQIATLTGPTTKLLALCDDGSIWQLAPTVSTQWERIRAEIPND